jgi:GH15 family glucan-1,4-alpha-glucosidase
VRDVADYLAQHWREPDHGIWEEETRLHYTSSKVIVACGLDSIAEFADDAEQVDRWRKAVRDIRRFVAEECMTSEGAYASYAGGEDVDVSAALFPVWAYADADAPEMVATMSALERDHSPDGRLFRRSLVCANAAEEGAFLAGTFWVAHYWIIRGDFARARRIIDRALGYANDLGLFAEEADPASDGMIGNFPQTFVHAAFIGSVVDLRAALEDDPSAWEREISHAS